MEYTFTLHFFLYTSSMQHQKLLNMHFSAVASENPLIPYLCYIKTTKAAKRGCAWQISHYLNVTLNYFAYAVWGKKLVHTFTHAHLCRTQLRRKRGNLARNPPPSMKILRARTRPNDFNRYCMAAVYVPNDKMKLSHYARIKLCSIMDEIF